MKQRGAEKGTTTTPFDMTVLNDLDRFHLAMDVVHRLPWLGATVAQVEEAMRAKLLAHAAYIREYGDDMPDIRDWKWPHGRWAAQ